MGLNVATALLCATYQLLVMIPLGLEDLVFKLGSIGAVVGVGMIAALSTTQSVYWAFATWSLMNGLALPYFVHVVRRRMASIEHSLQPDVQ